MTTYVSNCGSDFGEMICVNKWDTEDDVVSYDSESGFGGGMTYHDSLDAASGELNWDQPSPQFGTCRGMNFNREPIIFSDLEHWSDANCDDSSDRNCYDDFDGNCVYQYGYSISEISGMRHDESCSMKYDTAWNESNACTDYEVASLGNDVKHEVDTKGYGRYAEFNHVDASRTHCPSYAPSTYLTHTHMKPYTYQFSGHHPTSYSLHKQPQRSSRPTPYVPPHLRQYPNQRQALPSYQKPSYMRPHHNSPPMSPHTAHNGIPSHRTHVSSSRRHYRTHTYATTASAYTPPPYERFVPPTVVEEVSLSSSLEAQRKDYVDAYLADKDVDIGHVNVAQPATLYEHHIPDQLDYNVVLELCAKEHEVILQDCHSLMQRVNGAVEEEKPKKKLGASLLCLEKEQMDKTVFVMGDQLLGGNEIELIDSAGFMIGHELAEHKTNLVRKNSDEKERKTEPSVCLKNAMRCLEIQRKIWVMGSLLSVIPAVPLHHFDDPFLVKMKKDEKVPSTCAAAWLRALFWSDESHIWGASEAANDWGNTHLTFTFGYELTVSLRGLPLVSWARHLQKEWIFTISGSWNGLWRPPDTIVRVYDSLVWLLVLRGFWFDRGRPPEIWAFPYVHRIASRTKPF